MGDINKKDILLHQKPVEAEPAIDSEPDKTEMNAPETLDHESSVNTAAQSIPDTLPVLPVRESLRQ